MSKYINLKVGQSVTHKKYKGRGDVVSFDADQGFLVRWLHNGQDVYYSPGTAMLEVVEHPVEKTGQTKAALHIGPCLGIPPTPMTGRPKSNALDNARHTSTTSEIVEMRNQITGRTLKEVQAVQGPGFGAMSFCSRVQGTSTAQALSMVSNAILHPYTWHKCIQDHHGTVAATRSMFSQFKRVVEKLELKGFEFKEGDLQYRCVPIVKETRRLTSETIIESYR